MTGLEVALKDVAPIMALSLHEDVSFPDILERLELPQDFLDDPEGYIPLVDYFRIIGQLSLIFYDETCNLSERPMVLGTAKFMLDSLGACRTLREIMEKLAEVGNIVNGGPYNQVREIDDQLQFICDDSRFPYALTDENFLLFGMECILMLLHGMFEYLLNSGETLPQPYISIKRSAESTAKHLSFWQKRIRHRSPTYVMSYDKELGDIPLTPPEEGYSIYAWFEKVVELVGSPRFDEKAGSMTQRVRREMLDEKVKDQQQVASLLGVSVATMRRRLKEEGTSFREVRQQALEALALHFLDGGVHPNDVAEKLGFSDLRSFSRAFKSWHNQTPSEYIASKH
ncbi:MAG: helix-turn-helix transcriptional regulator [Cellvibrionaceae bacterium]